MKFIVSQEIPKPCCVNYIKFIFVNYLCTIKSYLWQEGCMCLAYAYKLLSTNRFQYSYPIHNWHCHGNRKGRACATFVSWQDISIERNPCLCGPEDAEAMKHSKKMSRVFRKDKTSRAFDLMLSPRTAGDLSQQKHHPSSMDN